MNPKNKLAEMPIRPLLKTTDNSHIYNRAFPVGNALFFFTGDKRV